MPAHKIRAIIRLENGTELLLLPETLISQIQCPVPNESAEAGESQYIWIALDELLNQYADEINDARYSADFASRLSAELVRNDLQQNRALKTIKTESGTITLTNSLAYPFNNSEKSVTIAVRDTVDYAVDIDTGTNKAGIGRVIVYDKLKNGFKIAFTGGAASATIKYTVRGGLL